MTSNPSAESGSTSMQSEQTRQLPLYVDLDGTLIYTDLLFESVLQLLKKNPLYLIACLFWVCGGRAKLKAEIAKRVEIDATLLPFNLTFLDYLRSQHAIGRRIILASASNEKLVQRVADHLGLFDVVMGSDAHCNLKSAEKLRAIQAQVGDDFAYAGNSRADLAVWKHAQEILVVNASSMTMRSASALRQPVLLIPPRRAGLAVLLKALRLHQWAKNALLFLPLLAAHDGNADSWLMTILAFISFGITASATYVINDLLDLDADRAHPRKRQRAFAAATLSIPLGIMLALVLLPAGLLLAASVSLPFLGLMLLYVTATILYSARLKKIAFIDVLVLAMLYTHRIFAGGVAGGVEISSWLLIVSLFMFLSLALIKRCVELELMGDGGNTQLAGRGYRKTDLPYLVSMGTSSGLVAVMVLALYVESQIGGIQYPHADLLWLMLPPILYWIMRLWIKTSRRELHDDPLVFAITDPISWVLAGLIGIIAVAASVKQW